MSKKPLPKRTLAFKLEKHPTAERLEALRAQGIENIEDLDSLVNTTTSPTDQTIVSPTVNLNNILLDQANVAIDGSKTSPITDPINIPTQEVTISATNTAIANTINEPIVEWVKDLTSVNIKEALLLETQKINTPASDIVTDIAIPTASNTANHIINHTNQTIATDTAIATNTSPVNQIDLSDSSFSSDSSEDFFHKLQETHSVSAQVIYKLLTELISKRQRPIIRIGTKQLLEKTGIKSHVTVRKAIDELIIKLSLEIIEANQGKIPPVYKLITPEEVFYERAKANIIIDEDTKFAFQLGQRLWPINNKTNIDTTSIDTSSLTSIPIVSHTGEYITSPIVEKSQLSKPLTSINKDLLTQLKPICDKLLIKINDSSKLSILNNYPLPHIIIGICKTKKSEPNKTLSLLDCLEEIITHYQTMNALPETILSQVAYDQFATLSKLA